MEYSRTVTNKDTLTHCPGSMYRVGKDVRFGTMPIALEDNVTTASSIEQR